MDYLDVANPKRRFTSTASFYPEPMDGTGDGGIKLNYEYVNPFSNTYRRVFGNIQASAGEVTIRTDDQLKFNVNGIVITQDGNAFKIIQVEKDFQATPKQALRLFSTPVSTQYVIRLVGVDNPWGLV